MGLRRLFQSSPSCPWRKYFKFWKDTIYHVCVSLLCFCCCTTIIPWRKATCAQPDFSTFTEFRICCLRNSGCPYKAKPSHINLLKTIPTDMPTGQPNSQQIQFSILVILGYVELTNMCVSVCVCACLSLSLCGVCMYYSVHVEITGQLWSFRNWFSLQGLCMLGQHSTCWATNSIPNI